MARFIELHKSNNDGQPILINVDWIASVNQTSEHTVIHIGVINSDDRPYSVFVNESYYAVKEMIL